MTATAFPVELKVNVAGPVADALSLLVSNEGSKRRIWFLEDLTPGLGTPLPLFSAGVLLRLRSGKTDDSTVKLRPCRRTQLAPEWTHDFQRGNSFTYRVEADWTGARRSLAASAVQELGSGLIDSVTLEGADAGILFDGKQQEFLHECADLRVALAGLASLGPIEVRKWNDIEIGELSTNLERWTVGSLDFLEVSFRSPSGAAKQQLRLEGAIRAVGLSVDENPQSKTGRVLAELARIASQNGAEHETLETASKESQ